MITEQLDVAEFQKAAGQNIKNTIGIPNENIKELIIKLLKEEVVTELITAIENDDLIGVADGLADSLYILLGAANFYGITPLKEVFDDVHKSNMTKFIDGHTDKDSGKWIKGPSYTPVDINKSLDKIKTIQEAINNQ